MPNFRQNQAKGNKNVSENSFPRKREKKVEANQSSLTLSNSKIACFISAAFS